ncbi:ead/Ea22-like family protein [Citrobacter portucalensis]|uniref:hypothetical protein n=1 Tax=Citrobacter portucalensis TaxID=1639133 RepID=UPI0022443D02|nr:hypothetical protein [Citrobacter portucalensis]MCW8354070.1 ead/Ea22-like family protein [Citrobacter portucalensis]MCX9044607.1 ead/Ea22-like family protein [Citrobacter portucalensis]
MTALNKQALRGQIVEGSFYLAECGYCGEMYPSNKLDGGEPLFSGDYGECFCHLCGADDSDIADNGAWGSEAVTAWNYQQKRIEALLDELEAAEKRIAELEARKVVLPPSAPENLAACLDGYDKWVIATTFRDTWNACLSEVIRVNAAGIGVKGE